MTTSTKLKFYIGKNAVKPKKGSKYSAGYDLFPTKETVIIIKENEKVDIDIEVKVEIPEGYYGRVAPRSGLAKNNGISVLAGVIDSDYRGNIIVLIHKLPLIGLEKETIIPAGKAIAQLIIEKIYEGEEEMIIDDIISKTERGEGGFGSTDEKKQ